MVHDTDKLFVAAPCCPAPEGCVHDFNEDRPMGPVMSDFGFFGICCFSVVFSLS